MGDAKAIAHGLTDEASRLAAHARSLRGKGDAAELAVVVLTFSVVEIMAVVEALMKRKPA